MPILLSPEDFTSFDMEATHHEGEVTDVPRNFKKWVGKNEGRIASAKKLPNFLKDNERYWKKLAENKKAATNEGKTTDKARSLLTDEQKAYRKQLQKEAISKYKGLTVENHVGVMITSKGIKEFLNQPHSQYFEKNELVKDLPNVIKSSKYIHRVEYHKDNFDIVASHIFETEINGKKSYLIAWIKADHKSQFTITEVATLIRVSALERTSLRELLSKKKDSVNLNQSVKERTLFDFIDDSV